MTTIREAKETDIACLMKIFDRARMFMAANGNPDQWIDGYPSESLIIREIAAGHCFVICNGMGEPEGTFCFIIGDDPTYSVIENGSWLNNRTYGTIHRLASGGRMRGIGKACIDWCAARIPELRADTHRANLPMQRLLKSNGFLECGIIYTHNGTERLAFHRSEG